jgi:autotransporter-associated beta strand protein
MINRKSIVFCGLLTSILTCIAVLAQEAGAATITTTINSSQSVLTAVMICDNVTAVAQDPGALSDSYSGTITASLANNILTFTGGSSIVALAATNAFSPPLGGANTEGSPQNYGGLFSNISVPPYSAAYTFNSDADMRQLNANITSGSAALGGPANGLTFTLASGATNFSVPTLPLYGVTAGYYSTNLAGSSSTNASNSAVTLTVTGSTETLTIPVNITYKFSEQTIPASFQVTGNLVATAVVPSGGTWAAPGSGSWTTASNWSSCPAVPSSGTVAFVGGSAPSLITLDGNQSAGGLLFNLGGTNGYTLSRGTGSAFTLGTTAAGASIAVLSGTQTISAPIVLGGNLVVSTTAGDLLKLSGGVSQATPGLSLSLSGNGALVLSGTDSYRGGTAVLGGKLFVASNFAIAAGTSLTVGANAASLFAPAAAEPSISVSAELSAMPVPEPSTFGLFGVGAMFLFAWYITPLGLRAGGGIVSQGRPSFLRPTPG